MEPADAAETADAAEAADACVAARVPFSKLCGLLERVSRARGVAAKRALVSGFAAEWRALHAELHGSRPSRDSFFPALRLLLPQCDKARQAYGIKEHSLAKLFIELLCLGKDSPDALKLLNFRSPRAARHSAGDFAEVVFFVLKHRCPERGALSLAQVNTALDEVAAANAERGAARKAAMRGSLMRLLRGLSALEQKWLVRMLMKELKMGASHVSVLNAFHEDAEALFDVTQDLEAVCLKLHDARRRLHEIDIALFSPFRPMLAARGAPAGIEAQMGGGRFLLETKFDGERVQVHKDGDAYRFWSRNGLEWTEAYGPDPSRGSFTPFVHRCFAPHVRSCILDGEMMGYSAERAAFGSKAQDFDVKRAGVEERTGYAPCLLAFDVLLLNEEVLTNRPLTERKRLLQDCFTEEPGRLQLSEWREADSAQQCAEALNAAVDAREEGVMAKRADSVYAAGSRKGGWVKLKPDYVGGMMDELDLLIVGGYYGSGQRAGLLSHFLLAVAKAGGAVDEQGRPAEFLSLCKVGSGYSKQTLEAYNRKMAPLWRSFDKARPPTWLKLAKERPDVWVPARDSSLVQVRASEITDSEQYAAGCTLRFPRVECFREDKAWHEAMTSEELAELRAANEGKLAGHHLDLMAPGSGEEGGPAAAKKRKKAPVRSRPAVARRFRGIEAAAVTTESSVLAGNEFCVMAAEEKTELERRIAAAGGEPVQNPGRRTRAVVADRVNVKVRGVIQRGSCDVVRPCWLLRSLKAGCVLPFAPEDLLHATEATKRTLAKSFDAHGDSYVASLESTASLEALLAKVETGAAVEGPEVADLVHTEFQEEFGCLFGCTFYLDDKAVLGQAGTRLRSPLDLVQADLLRAGGRIEERLCPEVSHVIAAPDWDASRLTEIRAANATRKRRFHLLDARWVEACLERSRLLPERPFALPCP